MYHGRAAPARLPSLRVLGNRVRPGQSSDTVSNPDKENGGWALDPAPVNGNGVPGVYGSLSTGTDGTGDETGAGAGAGVAGAATGNGVPSAFTVSWLPFW
jgi:hypothetical protein